jgi:hypothetical protein
MLCLAAVEGQPLTAYLCRVTCSERSRPEIRCWVLAGRRSLSAALDVGGILRSRGHWTSNSRLTGWGRRHRTQLSASDACTGIV